MLENEITKQILNKSSYTITLNTKFQLLTKNCDPAKINTVEETIKAPETKIEMADSDTTH